jgi:hypothetical protein
MSLGSTSQKRARRALHAAPPPSGKSGSPLPHITTSVDGASRRRRKPCRKSLPAWLGSLAFHVAVFLVCLPLTFVTLTGSQIALWISPSVSIDQSLESLSELEIEPADWQPQDVEEVALTAPAADAAGQPLSELVRSLPVASAIGNTGTPGMMPSELGKLMSTGDGGTPGGLPAAGAATFFGTRSSGSRFVFVIDNSRSMKGGRLEAAVAELLQSVGAMSRRQSFYVIFVSDQTYPMFYPDRSPDLVPATAANKERLQRWLQKLQLAPGDNRKLIEAMDLAASLRPEVVYLLWDGDMRYSERVRQDVMRHLASPNEWSFPIHTLCMGEQPPGNEQNLVDVARVHGGTYRRVDVPATHRQ